MADNIVQQPLGLDQIADVINRSKLGEQKKKNEMMRLGTSDPTAFQLQYKDQLLQQQQPQEFWGAGRKLAQNQNPDEETLNYVGGALPKLGGQHYYYGDTDFSIPENIQNSILGAGFKTTSKTIDPTIYNLMSTAPITKYRGQEYYKGDVDPSNAQWGTQGYNQQDLGDGRYNILDTSGNTLGIGYKNLEDTIKELALKYKQNTPINAPVDIEKQIADQGGSFFPQFPNPTEYSNTSQYSAGDLDKWEVLGQLLNGNPIPIDATSNRSSLALSGDNINQSIKGLQSLYGSTPLIYNGKLAGYKMDPTPATEDMLGYVNPLAVNRQDNSGNTRFNYALQREYQDTDKWNELTKSIDSNNLFVPTENAEQLPGWINKDNAQYQHISGGMMPKLAQGLGAILQFTPFAPAGLALNTLTSLTQGNHLGGVLGAITGGLGQAGVFDKLGSKLGDSLGLGDKIGKAFVQGGLGSLSSLASGGGIKNALLSGLGSGIGPIAGDFVASGLGDTLGKTGAGIVKGGVSGALKSLFNKGNPIEGAIGGGLSSGLGDFISTMTNNTGENIDSRRNNELAKTIVNIARQQYKRNK